MSKDKWSMQDVTDVVSREAGITKTLADDFFRAFIAVLEEGLSVDEQVRIKDFGTFRRTWVAPRKSVNVQTGEDIVIDGYHKVVFVPERALKERVNLPFAHLEPVVLDAVAVSGSVPDEDAPLTVLSEQADEIKNLLSEIQSMSPLVPAEPEKKRAGVEIAPPVQPVVEVQAEAKSRSFQFDATTIQPIDERRHSPMPRVLAVVAACLVVSVGAYFAVMPVQHWVNRVFFGYDTAAYDAVHTQVVAGMTPAATEQAVPTSEEAEPDSFRLAFDNRLLHPEYQATETLNRGSRLAHLADRYYGSPYFWVYIYEANMEAIPDPNQVREGAVVHIPRMDPRLVDADSPRALEAAWALRDKYLQ